MPVAVAWTSPLVKAVAPEGPVTLTADPVPLSPVVEMFTMFPAPVVVEEVMERSDPVTPVVAVEEMARPVPP